MIWVKVRLHSPPVWRCYSAFNKDHAMEIAEQDSDVLMAVEASYEAPPESESSVHSEE